MLFFSWLNYWSSTLKINLSLLQNSYANPNAFLQLNERIGGLNLKIFLVKLLITCTRTWMCVVGEFNEVFWGIHRIKGDILIFGKRLLNLIRSNICVFLEQTRQDKFYFHFRFYQQSFSLSLTFRILIWKTAQSHIKILDKTHIVNAAQIFSLKDFRFNLQPWKGFLSD